MHTSERQIHERIGSALFRLGELGQRVEAAGDSPKAAGRLSTEVRKLTSELERMFSDVQQMASRYLELQDQATAACKRGERIFEQSPVPCALVDTATGAVTEANAAAVRLLNVSHRHLIGRSFLLFLNGDRDEFLNRLRASSAEPERGVTLLRPRERSGIKATLVMWRDAPDRVFVLIVPADGPFVDAGGDCEDVLAIHADAIV